MELTRKGFFGALAAAITGGVAAVLPVKAESISQPTGWVEMRPVFGGYVPVYHHSDAEQMMLQPVVVAPRRFTYGHSPDSKVIR